MPKRRYSPRSIGWTMFSLLLIIALSRLGLLPEREPGRRPTTNNGTRQAFDGSSPRAANDATKARETFRGRVTWVSDGDSLTVQKQRVEQRVRLFGIDCPELAQDDGEKAKRMTHRLSHGRTVEVVAMGRDQYDRILAEVFIDGQSLNRELLIAGLAWVYGRHDQEQEWRELEKAARVKGRGLWAESRPTPPWTWRKANPRQ